MNEMKKFPIDKLCNSCFCCCLCYCCLYNFRDFTRPDLPSGDPEATPLPDLSAYGI